MSAQMLNKRSLLALAAAGLGACATHRTGRTSAFGIDPGALRAHMEFLADDALEGREAGTRGYDLAALYVASQFRRLGLEAAGTRSFFQDVPLRRSVLTPGSVRLEVTSGANAITFTDNDHVQSYPSLVRTDMSIEGEAVFAGNGIVAPQYGRDDYAHLDVSGKIVLVLGGPPAGLPAEMAAHLGAAATQAARAKERGAIGLIVLWTPVYEQRLSFERLAGIARQSRVDWYDPTISPEPGGASSAAAFVSQAGARVIFHESQHLYADLLARAAHGPVPGFPLDRRIRLSHTCQIDHTQSANVAALLPGTDPHLRNEIIVVTCHLDHVGIGAAVGGDSIYNGAIDNASGVASTIEVARCLLQRRLRRSVLFLAVTAEEKGLVGSDYFARSPTVPTQGLVGAINLDGVMAFYDFESVIGYGVESSTLAEPLHRAVQAMGLGLMPDPHPELSIFTRSDHYSFVTQGVPAIFLQMGDGRTATGESGVAFNDAWDALHLHQPSDELELPINYGEFARFTELYARFTHEAANMRTAPLWYEGDFFGEAFAPNARRARR